MSRIISFDYSLSSPAVCVLDNSPNFLDCKFYYLSSTKKYIGNKENLVGFKHKDYSSFQERYENIANQFLDVIEPNKNDIVLIEDYSLGSKGLVFSIAENCGILKYLLYKRNIIPNLISPSTIKKSFTSKGNADKKLMYEYFVQKTNINLYEWFGMQMIPHNIGSPFSDIVDSYALSLVGYETKKTKI